MALVPSSVLVPSSENATIVIPFVPSSDDLVPSKARSYVRSVRPLRTRVAHARRRGRRRSEPNGSVESTPVSNSNSRPGAELHPLGSERTPVGAYPL